jgi:hypothetical protein
MRTRSNGLRTLLFGLEVTLQTSFRVHAEAIATRTATSAVFRRRYTSDSSQ